MNLMNGETKLETKEHAQGYTRMCDDAEMGSHTGGHLIDKVGPALLPIHSTRSKGQRGKSERGKETGKSFRARCYI